MSDSTPSNWKEATDMINLTFLRDVRDFIVAYYEQWGQWPSPEQIRAHLHKPGS